MNKKAMYFLRKEVNLIMVVKKVLLLIILILFNFNSYSNILYKNNNLVITDIDLNIYKKLYKDNYGLDIKNNRALKDLILIMNVLEDLEKNNIEFINKIDKEISLEYGNKYIEDENLRNFIRFSKIRNEFIINYFNNKLNTKELKELFVNIDNLKLPISNNDCLIINKVINLQHNDEFVKGFYNKLKNNLEKIMITIDKNKYQVCIDEVTFKSIENLIVEYIRTQTNEEFERFIYDKTKY
tara:strand:- start:2420 stop:3139 length:720 start_codon:yes stop_codon:yes gene_type:complete